MVRTEQYCSTFHLRVLWKVQCCLRVVGAVELPHREWELCVEELESLLPVPLLTCNEVLRTCASSELIERSLYTLGSVRLALQLKFNNNELICLPCLLKQHGSNPQLQADRCVCSSGVFLIG